MAVTWKKLAYSDTKLDDWASPDDNTDLNATTSAHGLLPKLDNTATNYLNGTGAWSEPAGGGGGVSFTELVGGQAQQVSDTETWEDWDVSAIVPAGTVAVLVGVMGRDSSTGGDTRILGARKNGSALARYFTCHSDDDQCGASNCVLTECDSNRVIEIYAEAIYGAHFDILGYWS